ncbi:MAG: hypothetical protein K1X31_06575 [Gemmatimonadaceae bacterium]|nr:hypothetical protein [Gemmatimonadaceae bacterium]
MRLPAVLRPVRAALLAAVLVAPALAAQGGAAGPQPAGPRADANDPRSRLRPGLFDAGIAVRNMELVSTTPRPASFTNPNDLGDFAFINADLAFKGDLVFQGGYHGIQVWDVRDPKAPVLRATIACPGGQGDVSVHGNLLFMSVEETRGRVDCGTQGVRDTVSAERFRGVRIFDISDLAAPKVVAQVQTCRGSHTHTLLASPRDRQNLYVYVSGTSVARSGNELAGCNADPNDTTAASSYFRIEVIRVPLARPQDARLVGSPRVFADARGNVAGLWKGGAHGAGTQETARTDMCHDITVYAELGIAAGACSGNGILLDLKDPANPKRIAEVSDPNFAYWHSATFNNAGTTILYTDEWGGGVGPRCRATDHLLWGANAYFRRAGRALTAAGFFKLPAAQTAEENCVAHNGNLVPVPGRDLFVQAWYQGGISVTDFTDPDHVREIAYFDRGPVSAERLVLSGQWSAYWYNGRIYGSEIARGLDILELTPSGELTQNELEAARLARVEVLNPQDQRRITWPAAFPVARAYYDQLYRWNGLPAARLATLAAELDAAERATGAERKRLLDALGKALDRDAATAADAARVRALAGVVKAMARDAR